MPEPQFRIYYDAVVDMAGLDSDYATGDNQMGFSRFDSPTGHALADLPWERWSVTSVQQAARLLRRYRNTQLPGLGYTWSEFPPPPTAVDPVDTLGAKIVRQPGFARVSVANGRFLFSFGGADPHFRRRIDDIKSRLISALYDRATRSWSAPVTIPNVEAVASLLADYASSSLPFTEPDDFRDAVSAELDRMEDNLHASARKDADPSNLRLHRLRSPDMLRPFQVAGIAYAATNRQTIIADDMGLGKGMIHGTGVLTPSGYVPVESLTKEHEVIGSDGLPHKVKGVYHRGELPVYRVAFNDGTSVVVDGDHLWNVQHVQNGRRNPEQWLTLSVEQLIESGTKDGAGNSTWRIPMVQPIEMIPADQPIDPYLLGVLLGDGGMTGTGVVLSSVDEWMLYKVDSLLPEGVEISAKSGCDYVLSSGGAGVPNPLIRSLKSLGLFGLGSHDKFVPDAYMVGSSEDRLSLLRGLMDTDGSARADGINEFCSVSPRLADAVAWITQSLGGIARRSVKALPGGGIAHRVNIKLDVCPFAMPRKVVVWKAPTKYPPGRIIKSIEPAGVGNVTCIAVDAPDALFVTEHCIVTHNTLQALASVCETDALPALIICPASLKLNWKREVEQWISLGQDGGLPIVQIAEGSKPKGVSTLTGTVDFFIINYDILPAWLPFLLAHPWKGVIADECHYVKSSQAKRSKAVREIVETVNPSVRLLLTGTPILNRPAEMWPLLSLIGGQQQFGSWWKFAERYCEPQRNGFGYAFDGASNLNELNMQLRSSGLMIRRKKEDVLPELPDKQWAHLALPMSPGKLKDYERAERDLVEFLNSQPGRDSLYSGGAEALVRISTLRQLAWQAKEKAAREWIDEFLKSGKKLIIFGWHREIVQRLADLYNAPMIAGGMKKEDVESGKHRFQTDPECRVIVCNIAAGGVGHTLTAASDVAFIEFAWNDALMDQAISRAHRIGQTNSVTGWLLTAARPSGELTIDDEMIATIAEKGKVSNMVVNGTGVETQRSALSRLRSVLASAEEESVYAAD